MTELQKMELTDVKHEIPEDLRELYEKLSSQMTTNVVTVWTREYQQLIERIAQLTAERDKERKHFKELDAIIDDEHVANSCINPFEDLRIAIRKLKAERDAALREVRIEYYRKDGELWERRSIGDQVLFDIPSPVVFFQPGKWPWEMETKKPAP